MLHSLTNNVFLFVQKKITSVSSTPSSSITSYNPLIFYFIGAIFSSIFLQTKNNLILQSNCIFNILFICFSGNPLHRSKNKDLKCFPNTEFFSRELIKIMSNINSAEMHMSFFIFH